ncbi:MAG: hypothetical protein Q7S76_03770 [bacterium]|nr:hypothetical protein [bacterium]
MTKKDKGFEDFLKSMTVKDFKRITKKSSKRVTKNPFKPGDKVKYKDGDPRVFTVLMIYSPTHVSLGLYSDPDTEQDSQTNIKDIKKA